MTPNADALLLYNGVSDILNDYRVTNPELAHKLCTYILDLRQNDLEDLKKHLKKQSEQA